MIPGDKKWRTTIKSRNLKRLHFAKYLNIADKIALNKRNGLTHVDERISPQQLEMERHYRFIMENDTQLTQSEYERYLDIAIAILNIFNQLTWEPIE